MSKSTKPNSIDIEKQKKIRAHYCNEMQDNFKKVAVAAIYTAMADYARWYDRETYPNADNDVFTVASELIHKIRQA